MVTALVLASASLYAAAMVLQHNGTSRVGDELSMRPALLARLGRRPEWWLGIGANAAGYGLRLVALGGGSLIFVQAGMSTSLLLALPVSAHLYQYRVGKVGWAAGAAVATGLVVLVAVVGTSGKEEVPAPARWIMTTVVVALLSASAMWAGSRWRRYRAALLACAGGVLLALTASLMKGTATAMEGGLSGLLRSWSPYALVIASAVMVLVVQSAFAAGPLIASLPALMATEVAASVAVGLALFREEPGKGPVAAVVAAAAVVLIVAGVVGAARTAAAITSQKPSAHRPAEVA